MGTRVIKALWKYQNIHRPEPAMPRFDNLFLTDDGYPLNKDSLADIIKRCGKKAGITNTKLSPHVFRHTMAVSYLRNGGDIFTLQRILGHSSLEVLKIYVNMAQSDISRVHQKCSPADNLDLNMHKI
jgi:integrase/recombinase XerD